MSLEIKVFLSANTNADNLCFHAVVYEKNSYDIFYDLNNTYEFLMKEALNGTFSFKFRNKESLQKEVYLINTNDYHENIILFVNFLNRFYKLNATYNDNYAQVIMGVRLVGSGFRGKQDTPMLESEKFNAMSSIHRIKTQLIKPSNNIDYLPYDDVYIRQSKGSLKLTLEATQNYTESIAFIKKIYDDIENMKINPFQFDEKEDRERYQKIIYSLNELNKQKRLENFHIIINNDEYEIKQRTYLKEKTKDIYKEEVTIVGNYESYSVSSKSFKVKVEKHGTFFCHLEELHSNDLEQFDKVFKKIKAKNIFDNTLAISVKGEKVNPKTINVLDIEFL